MQTIEVEDQIERADSADGLSSDELEFWEVKGYVGPFTAWTPEEVERMRPAISRPTSGPRQYTGTGSTEIGISIV